MAEENIERTAVKEYADPDAEILFEIMLAELNASNNKDRTRALIDAMNDDIKDMMQAINKYQKDGKITLTLKFKCRQANEMEISAEIKTEKPKGIARGTQMFRDAKGRLYMDDPNQTKLFEVRRLQEVKKGGN